MYLNTPPKRRKSKVDAWTAGASLMQNWFGYSHTAMEEALYEATIQRQFAEQELAADSDHPKACLMLLRLSNVNI